MLLIFHIIPKNPIRSGNKRDFLIEVFYFFSSFSSSVSQDDCTNGYVKGINFCKNISKNLFKFLGELISANETTPKIS